MSDARLSFPAAVGDVRLNFEAGWETVLGTGLVLLALGIALFAYRGERAMSRGARAAMSALRLLGLAALIVMLARPSLVTQSKRVQKPNVLLLADHSASMSTADVRKTREQLAVAGIALGKLQPGESPGSLSEAARSELARVPRRRLVQSVLSREQDGVLQALAAKCEVRYFGFDERLRPAADARGLAKRLEGDGGRGTYLGSAMLEAVDAYAGQRCEAVIVLTDGCTNGGRAPMAVARELRARAVKVYTFGVGLPAPDDLSLSGMVVQDVVFPGDKVPVRVQANCSGYERRQTPLRVLLDGHEVARKRIKLTGKSQLAQVSFEATGSAGTRRLTVELTPLEGEATEANNSVSRTIRIVNQKIKVLCIEGSPRWEYRYLRAILKRDPRIDAQFIITQGDEALARASKEYIARFPEDPARAFEYDLLVLGDVKATTFTPSQLERIEQLVRDHGGSLILLAGPKHAPSEYVNTPIATMLPVWPTQAQWERVGKDVYPAMTPEGSRSTLMSLAAPPSRNTALWANIKPLGKVTPLSASGAKPGAHVLAVLSDSLQQENEHPLIAWHRCGAGKVLFVGTDRLWRLRERVGDKYHAKFWGQAIQFLTLSRLLGEHKRIELAVSPKRAAPGEPVNLLADVRNEAYEPESRSIYTVAVVRLDDKGRPVEQARVPLRPMPGTPGGYHGTFVPDRPGPYRLAAEENERDTASAADFEAADVTAEQADPALRKDLLEQMAETTGGRYLSINDLGRLPELIRPEPEVRAEQARLTLWDHWIPPAVFVTMLAAEWAWRRRRGLA